MNWNIIAAVSEIAGAVAVLITLLYLAQQIKQSNRQDLLAAYQHTLDTLNNWAVLVSGSADLAAIIIRGRKSYDDLNEADRFRFDQVHLHLLNLIEGHLFQVGQTSSDEDYRQWAIENLRELVIGYFDFPGTRQLWQETRNFYPPEVKKLVSESIGEQTVV